MHKEACINAGFSVWGLRQYDLIGWSKLPPLGGSSPTHLPQIELTLIADQQSLLPTIRQEQLVTCTQKINENFCFGARYLDIEWNLSNQVPLKYRTSIQRKAQSVFLYIIRTPHQTGH